MATKPDKTAARPTHAPETAPQAPQDGLNTPAHNIWLAGLGALASAQANAQAEGAKAFEALVQQGLEMKARTQALAKEQWAEAAQHMDSLTAGATGGMGAWDRLGGIFEGRVARALASLGMPSAFEIADLKTRVTTLERALAHAQGAAPAEPAAPTPTGSARRKGAGKST